MGQRGLPSLWGLGGEGFDHPHPPLHTLTHILFYFRDTLHSIAGLFNWILELMKRVPGNEMIKTINFHIPYYP